MYIGTADASLVGLAAGCLEDGLPDDEVDEITYELCDAEFVPLRELLREPSVEVETAPGEGSYATNETLVCPEVVRDDATLWDTHKNLYHNYDIMIDKSSSEADKSTLTFEVVAPSVASTGDPLVSNQTIDELEVSVTIFPENDAQALPGVALPTELGNYEVTVDVVQLI